MAAQRRTVSAYYRYAVSALHYKCIALSGCTMKGFAKGSALIATLLRTPWRTCSTSENLLRSIQFQAAVVVA
jgi:hypothetical protein